MVIVIILSYDLFNRNIKKKLEWVSTSENKKKKHFIHRDKEQKIMINLKKTIIELYEKVLSHIFPLNNLRQKTIPMTLLEKK